VADVQMPGLVPIASSSPIVALGTPVARASRVDVVDAQLATWSKEQELHDRFREVRTEHFSTFFESLFRQAAGS
jgi:hypothetical protein